VFGWQLSILIFPFAVAFTQCSNIFGTIHDAKAVAEMVHRIPGAEVL